MTNSDSPIGFKQVDASADPRFFIDFLDDRRNGIGEREIKELILRLLDLHTGMQVLDIGAGTGDDAREIAGMVGASGRVVGLDPSDAMLEEARRRAR
jgi:ubiquinone/menaquinone biosynthesis C-methylase UbiE